MPLYEYQCDACGHQFELIRRFSDPPVTVCPNCGAEQVRKLVSSPAFQFKGSGWYVTDYARKSGEGGSSTGSSKSSSESKTDEAKTETKADSSTESKADKGTAASTDKPAAPAGPPKDKS
jgi:putative FmdB family regulatory protein